MYLRSHRAPAHISCDTYSKHLVVDGASTQINTNTHAQKVKWCCSFWLSIISRRNINVVSCSGIEKFTVRGRAFNHAFEHRHHHLHSLNDVNRRTTHIMYRSLSRANHVSSASLSLSLRSSRCCSSINSTSTNELARMLCCLLPSIFHSQSSPPIQKLQK